MLAVAKTEKGAKAQEDFEANLLQKQSKKLMDKQISDAEAEARAAAGLTKEVVDELAKNIKDKSYLQKVQAHGVQLFNSEKRAGNFDNIPITVMKKASKNIMRDLKQNVVQEKVKSIGSEWWNQTPMVGCITQTQWENTKDYFLSHLSGKPMAHKPAFNDLVETLDGQHRLHAAAILVQQKKIKNPTMSLILFVGLTEEEKRVIALWYNEVQKSMAQITLVDLLKQMREAWLDLLFGEKKLSPVDAEVQIIAKYHPQIMEMTRGTTAKKLKEVIDTVDVSLKPKTKGKKKDAQEEEKETEDEKRTTRNTVFATALVGNHNKLRGAYQVVPGWPTFVWVLWYTYLKDQETRSPLSVHHYSELSGMSMRRRHIAMAYAAVNKLSPSSFRALCRYLKGREFVIKFLKETVVPTIAEIRKENAQYNTPLVLKAQDYWLNQAQVGNLLPILSITGGNLRQPKLRSPDLQYASWMIINDILASVSGGPKDLQQMSSVTRVLQTTRGQTVANKALEVLKEKGVSTLGDFETVSIIFKIHPERDSPGITLLFFCTQNITISSKY